MIDPLSRRVTALNRTVNRMQSSQILSLSRDLAYATLTSSVNQSLVANAPTFLIWGYDLINSNEDNGISSPISFEYGNSVISIPRQGYYLFNLALTFVQPVPTRIITRLYVNDDVAQSMQQESGGYSNLWDTSNISFSVFLEENDSVQLAVIINTSTDLLATPSNTEFGVSYGPSPILHVVKLV